MTDFTLIQQRQQLEQTYRQPAASLQPLRSRTREQLAALWHKLVMALVMPKEPHIWTETFSEGDEHYHAYDPVNRETFVTKSETALRAWLETRYYR
ncbi:MAG: hypothetical protein AAGG51_14495 [Cyanobacteria bacterium P01_G01_bin.54]